MISKAILVVGSFLNYLGNFQLMGTKSEYI